jgi:monothiol glutaredoxin
MNEPNKPATVQQLTAEELKAMMDRGDALELIDVRTEEERTIAMIAGARHLNEEGRDYLLRLDRDTRLVFQCHHGIRSQAAAQYFVGEGFRNVYNLRGGIEAWSRTVDPGVPRY